MPELYLDSTNVQVATDKEKLIIFKCCRFFKLTNGVLEIKIMVAKTLVKAAARVIYFLTCFQNGWFFVALLFFIICARIELGSPGKKKKHVWFW